MLLKNFKNKLLMILFTTIFIIPLTVYGYSENIVLGGENVGIEVKSTGVLIVGFYNVENTSPGIEAGLKIGDGKAYVIDLPFLNDTSGIDFDQHINNTTIHITNEEREFWNNKINCRDTVISETLFLTRN